MTDPEPDAPTASDAAASTVGADGADGASYSDRIHSQITRARAKVDAQYRTLQGRRSESRAIDVAFRVAEADEQRGGGLIAGGMAFRIFVLLVPFAFVLVTVFAAFGKTVDSSDPTGVAHTFGITGLVALAITAATDLSTVQLILTIVVGTWAVLWSTWTMIRALRVVHGLAWDELPLPPFTRPWYPTLLTAGGILAVFLAGTAVSRIGDAAGFPVELVFRVLAFGVFVAAWAVVSWLLPHAPDVGWRGFLPGAVLFAATAEVLQFVTVLFFSRYIGNKTDTYGAIGAALVLLLWAYLVGRIIVAAAFLNAARWFQSHPPVPTGGETTR